MRYFVVINLEDKVYMVSNDFDKALKDEQMYKPCILYYIHGFNFTNSEDPGNYMFDEDEDDYQFLTNNGELSNIVNTKNPHEAVLITLFEGKF